MAKYVCFTEVLANEGFSWNLYIRLKGNTKDLEAFKQKLDALYAHYDGRSAYSLDLKKTINFKDIDFTPVDDWWSGRFNFIRNYGKIANDKATRDAAILLENSPDEWAKYFLPRDTFTENFALLTFKGMGNLIFLRKF